MTPPSEKELRCFCSRTPLLATYGIDRDQEVFLHVKIYKARRIFGEMIFKGGVARLKCRECFRWYTVRIVGFRANLEESCDQLPETIVE